MQLRDADDNSRLTPAQQDALSRAPDAGWFVAGDLSHAIHNRAHCCKILARKGYLVRRLSGDGSCWLYTKEAARRTFDDTGKDNDHGKG